MRELSTPELDKLFGWPLDRMGLHIARKGYAAGYAAAQSGALREPTREVGWLIETVAGGRYWCGGLCGWTPSPNLACRFARAIDANAAREWLRLPPVDTRVVEHIWIDASPQTGGSTDGRAGYSRDAGNPTAPPAAGVEPGPPDHQPDMAREQSAPQASTGTGAGAMSDHQRGGQGHAAAALISLPSLLAYVRELERERAKWNELHRVIAAELDCDAETWPDHHNAPLAIAATFMLNKTRAERAEKERESAAIAMRERCAQACEKVRDKSSGTATECIAVVRALEP